MMGGSQGGLLGTTMAAMGGMMTYRCVTGRGPLPATWTCCGANREARDGRPSGTPSYPHAYRRRAAQMPSDYVDAASMESFPVSDPPTRSRMSKVRMKAEG